MVSAGYEQCRPDYLMRRRDFPWYGIELISAGGGTLDVGGVEHDLVPGLVFSYGPGIAHAIAAAPAQPPGKWYLDLAGSEVEPLLRATGLAPGTAGLIAVQTPARALFELLIETGRRSGPEVDDLLAALARAVLQAVAHPRPSAVPDETVARASYERCAAWLERHAAHGAGVQEVAVAVKLSAAHVARLFQRFARTTPGAYARRIRLRRAADRLLAGAERVQAIAEAAGYADQFHFSRAFTREFGVPPRAFRSDSRSA